MSETSPVPFDEDAARAALATTRLSIRESTPAVEEMVPLPPPAPPDVSPEIARLRNLNGQLRSVAVRDALFSREPELPIEGGAYDAEATAREFLTGEKTSTTALTPRDLFRAAFAEARLSLEDLTAERVLIGWRLARETSSLLGILGEEELLVDGLPVEPDPWEHYCTPRLAMTEPRGAREKIKRWESDALERLRQSDVGLLPPEIPDSVSPSMYDPSRDARLGGFLVAMSTLASSLSMKSGVRPGEVDRMGLALSSMLDVETCRLAWPSRMQIYAFEEAMMADTATLLGTMSLEEVAVHLRGRGLLPRESRALMRLGLAQVRQRNELSLEDQRALMAARIEDYIARARAVKDLDREIKGIKTLVVVQGLTRTKPEELVNDFVRAIERVSREADKPEIDVKVIEAPVKIGEIGG